jgi:hypothetical protein
MFIPDSESEFFPSRIQGQKDSQIQIRMEELKYLNPKNFALGNLIRYVHPDPDLDFLPIPDSGVKKHRIRDPKHW